MDWSRRKLLYKKRLLKYGGGLVRFAFLLGVGYVTLYPLLFMISSSFMSVSDTLDATVVWLPVDHDGVVSEEAIRAELAAQRTELPFYTEGTARKKLA